MKVLVIGSGGREHALAWKAAQSPLVTQVFVAPGNAGTAMEPGVQNLAIAVDNISDLLSFAKSEDIGLTIIGPEVPLVLGIVDTFNEANLKCFGPTQYASQLEGSKAFSKDFLIRHGIPTAAYQTFTDADEAIAYIKQQGAPIVIKADGLAAGKGVVVANTEQEAITAASEMLAGNALGNAGKRIVIEEFLAGEEASFIVMTDGQHILPLATSQDHKARDDGDQGPNTGGMGAYSPAAVVTNEVHQRVMQEIIEPTIRGMDQEGHSYLGFLYAGLMIAPNGTVKVLEFNCRFGDPETQPIMMRLQSDLVTLCLAALDRKLHLVEAQWDKRAALGVVMAAGGYPHRYRQGDIISGLPTAINHAVKVFHSGTASDNGKVVSAGGRVLCVTALGVTVTAAQRLAYQVVQQISWTNAYYRKDIGYRAIAREQGM